MAAAVSAAGRAPLAAGDADRRTDSPSEAADEAGSRAAGTRLGSPPRPLAVVAGGSPLPSAAAQIPVAPTLDGAETTFVIIFAETAAR